MQFLLLARDYTDDDAINRRMAARSAHMETVARLKAEGHARMGAALLNEAGQMHGSMMVLDFPSRDELDAWLKEEPYVTGKVWKHIEIKPCKIAPSFE